MTGVPPRRGSFGSQRDPDGPFFHVVALAGGDPVMVGLPEQSIWAKVVLRFLDCERPPPDTPLRRIRNMSFARCFVAFGDAQQHLVFQWTRHRTRTPEDPALAKERMLRVPLPPRVIANSHIYKSGASVRIRPYQPPMKVVNLAWITSRLVPLLRLAPDVETAVEHFGKRKRWAYLSAQQDDDGTWVYRLVLPLMAWDFTEIRRA